MGSSYHVIFATTGDWEMQVEELSALPIGQDETEEKLFGMLWGAENIEVCTARSDYEVLECYDNDTKEAFIPKEIRKYVRLFLGALPSICWWGDKFKESPSIGKTYSNFQKFSDISIWFLTEQDVELLKEISGFTDALIKHCEQWEQSIADLPPLPKFFLTRKIAESERILDSKNLHYLRETIGYIELWIEVINEALEKKTGMLIFQT